MQLEHWFFLKYSSRGTTNTCKSHVIPCGKKKTASTIMYAHFVKALSITQHKKWLCQVQHIFSKTITTCNCSYLLTWSICKFSCVSQHKQLINSVVSKHVQFLNSVSCLSTCANLFLFLHFCTLSHFFKDIMHNLHFL